MEAKELMINDWVYRYDKPIQVTDGIYQGKVYTKDTDIVETKLNPIPLTKDILAKNGFYIRRDEYYLSCGFLGRSGIEIRFYDHVVIDIECNYFTHTNRVHLIADYVHELQQALRLCGLTELADNFKVIE